jgi:hypothetical protein
VGVMPLWTSVPPYNMHITRWMCQDNNVLSICTYTYITVVYFGNFKIQRDITPTKFRQPKFPGYMHICILCPYYLPSFMKFCSVVSEEVCWQAASEVFFGKLLSSKGHNDPVQCMGVMPLWTYEIPEIYFWSSSTAQLLWNYWREFHETW